MAQIAGFSTPVPITLPFDVFKASGLFICNIIMIKDTNNEGNQKYFTVSTYVGYGTYVVGNYTNMIIYICYKYSHNAYNM